MVDVIRGVNRIDLVAIPGCLVSKLFRFESMDGASVYLILNGGYGQVGDSPKNKELPLLLVESQQGPRPNG